MKEKYIVLERWNRDRMGFDVNLFDTEEEAKIFADYQAKQMAESYILGGTIKHQGDDEYTDADCYVYVDRDESPFEEWWEARIYKRETIKMKGEEDVK